MSDIKSVIDVDLVDEIKKSYINYAMSVIAARALPDVRDGLKPVHRRILYAMEGLNLYPNKAYKKSARIVGDTMGKYHPHGDSSIYEAMVRMAQIFSMRYTLVDGHGNFGSIDGDSAAAPRYTEARLSYVGHHMLDCIDKNTVDFIFNYDGEFKEPIVLPSIFPNLLANGSSGIAVGMATNIPPHNICELIDAIFLILDSRENKTDLDLNDFLKILNGPDFPTGANILGRDGIKQAYEKGRGKIIIRSTCEVKNNDNRETIVITELPYQVNKSRLVEKIAELVKDKKIDGISDLRDESDRRGIKIVIDIKRDFRAEIILNNLYKLTQLQETYGIIMLVLVNGEPKVLNLKQILDCIVNHQIDIVTRRTKFDLNKALERKNILDGYLIAIENIDKILKIIKESQNIDALKNVLIEKFKFNKNQVEAVIDMRFKSLTNLEKDKIFKESEKNNLMVNDLSDLLSDNKKLFDLIKEELNLIKEKYGDERRTKILDYDGEINLEDIILNKQNVIMLTKLDYIKRISIDNYKNQNRGGRGVKAAITREEDVIKNIFVAESLDNIFYFTNHGRVIKSKVYIIPEQSRSAKGIPVINLLNLNSNEKIATTLSIKRYSDNEFFIFITKKGKIKKIKQIEFKNLKNNAIRAINIGQDDELINVLECDDSKKVFVATKNGFGITFLISSIKSLGRAASGVRAIKLSDADFVIGTGIVQENTQALLVSKNGFGKCVANEEFVIQRRGGKGRIYYRVKEKKRELVGVEFVNKNDEVLIINSLDSVIRIKVSDIRILSRYAAGSKLIKLRDNSTVTGTAKISSEISISQND
ncbi:MAG: DNA gyrase subunit A [Clostridiales bacterium]|nr:DNA gyrase subunit A [Clostridiales bacterium]